MTLAYRRLGGGSTTRAPQFDCVPLFKDSIAVGNESCQQFDASFLAIAGRVFNEGGGANLRATAVNDSLEPKPPHDAKPLAQVANHYVKRSCFGRVVNHRLGSFSSASLRATASSSSCAAQLSTPFAFNNAANTRTRRYRSSVPATKNLLATGAAFFSLMARKLSSGHFNCNLYLTYILYTVYNRRSTTPFFQPLSGGMGL